MGLSLIVVILFAFATGTYAEQGQWALTAILGTCTIINARLLVKHHGKPPSQPPPQPPGDDPGAQAARDAFYTNGGHSRSHNG